MQQYCALLFLASPIEVKPRLSSLLKEIQQSSFMADTLQRNSAL